MPRNPEFDNAAPGPQLGLPAELLPTPADGNLQPAETHWPEPEVVVDPLTPETVRPIVERILKDESSDYDRVDRQAQTTSGVGTRERAKLETVEDSDEKVGKETKRRIAKGAGRRPQKTRRGLGPKGLAQADGPPAHVAAEVRYDKGL